MEIAIEDASIQLLNELYDIERQCFKLEAFSKHQIAYLLTNYNSISLAGRANNELAGFIIGQIEIEQDVLVGHIITLDIAPEYHRKGVAQRLLQEIELLFKSRGITECCLEVREDNTAAVNLYQKSGYQKVAKLPNYYKTAHGLYLRKTL